MQVAEESAASAESPLARLLAEALGESNEAETEKEEEERAAVLTFVMDDLPRELYHELLDGLRLRG